MTMLQQTSTIQSQPDADATRAMPAVVGRVLRRLGRLAVASRLLRAAALWLALVGALVLIDAAWPIGSVGRWGLFLLVIVAGLVGLCWTFWPRSTGERGRLYSASCVDHQLGLDAQPVVTAMTLDGLAPSRDELTQALRDRAQAQGHAAAQPAQPRRAAPLSLLGPPAWWLVYAVLGWLLLTLVMPTLPGRGLMRLFVPGFDVAPYNAVTFEVSWTPAPPTEGDTVTVLAKAQGRVPEVVEAVLLDDDLAPIERRALTPTRAGYELVFTDLREPVTFHLESFGRRTRRYTITPEPLPTQPMEDQPAQGSDPSADPDSAPRDPGGTAQIDDDPPSAEGATDAALDNAMGQLAGVVNDLAQLAERLQDSGDDAEPDESLAEALDQLSQEAGSLADRLDGASIEGDAGLNEALAKLAQALRSLEISGMSHAQPGGAPTEGDSDGRPWRDDAAQAARNDAERLAQGLGEAQTEIASGLSNRAATDPPPDFRDPRAIGGYDETAHSGEDGVLPDALMRQVPPRYREQTADYFRRLTQDSERNDASDTDPQEDSP